MADQSKGVGFIRFDQRHEAELAIKQFNGYRIRGSADSPLIVKFANLPTSVKNATSTATVSLTTGSTINSVVQPTLTATVPVHVLTDQLPGQLPFVPNLIELSRLTLPQTGSAQSSLSALSNTSGTTDLLTMLSVVQQARNFASASSAPLKSLRKAGGPIHASSTHRLRWVITVRIS